MFLIMHGEVFLETPLVSEAGTAVRTALRSESLVDGFVVAGEGAGSGVRGHAVGAAVFPQHGLLSDWVGEGNGL